MHVDLSLMFGNPEYEIRTLFKVINEADLVDIENMRCIGVGYDEFGRRYECFLAKYKNTDTYVCTRKH